MVVWLELESWNLKYQGRLCLDLLLWDTGEPQKVLELGRE